MSTSGLARPKADQFINQFILKVASRCNLNCSYCYVYNKADSTWQRRPALMSDDVFRAVLERVHRHCISTKQSHVNVVFHGGEPCLIGARRFAGWCAEARHTLGDTAKLEFHIQTNGTLFNAEWAAVFRDNRVNVGISMDGPRKIHDLFRVDHKGRGSHDEIVHGIGALKDAGVPFGILCVIPLGSDPLTVHRHFLGLGCGRITYVLPHFTHDDIGPVRRIYGATPCADFLIPVFDDWWYNSTLDVHVGDLWNIARIIMGGTSRIETVGNIAPLYVFIESDGEMEGLDNLRACEDGLARINLNVQTADFLDILQTAGMHKTAIFQGMPVPDGCQECPERETCAGGYLPHRYSRASGFNNPSVWCADLLKLFTHIRVRLGVSVEETRERRQMLERGRWAMPEPGTPDGHECSSS